MIRLIRTVLLVDDEPDIRTIGAMSLSRVGKFEVRTASSGGEALRLARENPPDLILLDVMMPELDGPATLQALRAQPETASTPVIFMTAKVLLDPTSISVASRSSSQSSTARRW